MDPILINYDSSGEVYTLPRLVGLNTNSLSGNFHTYRCAAYNFFFNTSFLIVFEQ